MSEPPAVEPATEKPPADMSSILPWCVAGVAVLAALGWQFLPSGRLAREPKRWETSIPPPAGPEKAFQDLLRPVDIMNTLPATPSDWAQPHVFVYSVPTIVPARPLPTLKDLTDNGQAHAIDYLAKSLSPPHSWDDLRQALLDANANAAASKDPFRFDRVLVATVVRGASWNPGERMMWTRVFVQPINFSFAGYTIAATENETVKITSVEATNTRKFSAEIGLTLPGVEGPKTSLSPSNESSVKTTADINAQFERLGVDIQPSFLRIIRESETGGDVAGNTTISLSILTDPVNIKKRWPSERRGETQGDGVVLVVTATDLEAPYPEPDSFKPSITALPQVPLPHCALRARIWMLHERREIKQGAEFYDESRQVVSLVHDADPPRDVVMVPADDVSPAVWAVQILPNEPESGPQLKFLGAKVDGGETRELVFTDYGQASKMAHWARTHYKERLNTLTLDYDGSSSLAPYKMIKDECFDDDNKPLDRPVDTVPPPGASP